MELINFVIFAAVCGFVFRKPLIAMYNKYMKK